MKTSPKPRTNPASMASHQANRIGRRRGRHSRLPTHQYPGPYLETRAINGGDIADKRAANLLYNMPMRHRSEADRQGREDEVRKEEKKAEETEWGWQGRACEARITRRTPGSRRRCMEALRKIEPERRRGKHPIRKTCMRRRCHRRSEDIG